MRHSLCSICLLLATLYSCSSDPSKPQQKQTKAQERQLPPAKAVAEQGGDLGYGDDAKLFATAGAAIAFILASGPAPKVLGFGEFHKLNDSAPVKSALRQFAKDMLSVVGPKSAHLILESWAVDPSCGNKGDAVTKKIRKAIERPEESENEMQLLIGKLKAFGMHGHLLSFTCDEYDQLLDKTELNHERLLTAVSDKLGDKTKALLGNASADKMIVVYGGSTHNDLFPYKGLESWSYADEIATITDNGFVEIDLYVPEFVLDDKLLSTEPWYPLLAEAREDKVILIRRSPRSYILILRKNNRQN